MIKTQRQILWFKLKIRKPKWPPTDSYLYLKLKWAILPLGILRLRLCLRPVSSCLIFLSSAGIKGVPHHLASVTN